ncbi:MULTISPECIES: hypothetical protein [Alphaproteobacteria]|uniref:Uncharacterized protein n=1 Tax=Sphingobium limneticum TaxID=1007511 RepID=A0A5J5HT59_9SPHN|nr:MULTISPECIES: hypothetical protein [Alphaproteobacteria]OHC97107.1 MAG: hypothetical protein A2095_08355 [Sphingomonadales bacterium GWF1_63_6]KAA9011816.1 hypothetical protein F4U94_19625 [Sphingobium limneticum]KAA9012905.1 hypothetical protein F4U96_19785 [Sphingobium limneticum]KAA9025152.1 hypothetical protein F4U95_19910 [Sphingobium limneticum]TAJ29463.1 MAG: hypothetical protein EPO59_15065 [Bosea sp. (in: a-proteobacteria)]
MTELNEEYISDLRQAVVKAICEVSAQRQHAPEAGKGGTLYIGTAEVGQMLTILLTEFLEGVPGLDTPSEVRRMSDVVARKIRLGIGEIRRHREETGGTPPPSIIIRSN